MEFVYSTPSCGEKDLRPALLKDVHYLYFALILLALTALIITAVSLCTAPIPEQHVTINCNIIMLWYQGCRLLLWLPLKSLFSSPSVEIVLQVPLGVHQGVHSKLHWLKSQDPSKALRNYIFYFIYLFILQQYCISINSRSTVILSKCSSCC